MVTVVKTPKLFKRCLLSVVLFGCQFTLDAQPLSAVDQKLAAVVDEARAYNLVKPKRSLQLLEQSQSLLANSSKRYRFLYYRTGFWASFYLYDSNKLFYFITNMLNVDNFNSDSPGFAELMYSLSLWYSANQEYDLAITAGECASKFTNDIITISRSNAALGLTYLMTDRLVEAERVFNINLNLNKKSKHIKGISVASNNLGLLHIFAGNYDLAEQHFRHALKLNEQMARANGTALNLIHLTLVFYLQGNFEGVQRLINRTTRAVQALDNQDLKHYLFWLNAAIEAKTQSPAMLPKQALLKHYLQINEPTVSKLIQLIAQGIDISLPVYSHRNYNQHINLKQKFPICFESSAGITPMIK